MTKNHSTVQRACLAAAAGLAAFTVAAGPALAARTAIFTQAPPPPGPPKALVDASVVDVLKGSVIPNGVILIDGDKIVAVGEAGKISIPANAVIIHLPHKWIAPGLINCHVHLDLVLPGAAGAALASETAPAAALRMEDNAVRTLYSGVTTIRLVGTTGGNDFVLKSSINRNEALGPRIETAGDIIAVTGGHGSIEADGPDAFTKAEREQIKSGATWIKIAISGGIADSTGDISASPMTLEEIKTAVDVAHRMGVPITAHNGSPVAAEEALAAGIDGFEHGYHLKEKQLQEMKQKGVWLVPTIVVSEAGALEFYKKIGSPDWYLDRVRSTGKDHWAMLQNAIRIGVPIALGTDQYPFEPNDGTTATIREAELYQKAGMTPINALRAATSTAARMLRLSEQVGSIEPGHYADLVVMDSDPTQDVRALRSINLVMKGGAIIRNDAVALSAPATMPRLGQP